MRTVFLKDCCFGLLPIIALSILALPLLVLRCNEARSQDEAEPFIQLPQEPPDMKAGQLVEWEEWSFRWQFRDDGSLCPEVGATGGLQHLNIGAGTDAGRVVGKDDQGEEVFAPSHVHNFYFRIDFDIDGADSNVAEEFSGRGNRCRSVVSAFLRSSSADRRLASPTYGLEQLRTHASRFLGCKSTQAHQIAV